MEPIICPSCGSRYNPETRELVEDTGLQARIRELEGEAKILREAADQVREKLAAAEAKIQVLETPAPAPAVKRAGKFIIG